MSHRRPVSSSELRSTRMLSCVSRRHLVCILRGWRWQRRAISVAVAGQLRGLAVEYYLGLLEISPGVWGIGR